MIVNRVKAILLLSVIFSHAVDIIINSYISHD